VASHRCQPWHVTAKPLIATSDVPEPRRSSRRTDGGAPKARPGGSSVQVAQDEANRRGHAEQVQFLHGDFLALAPAIAPADLVTLDRVLCCYPELEPRTGSGPAGETPLDSIPWYRVYRVALGGG
jgi:hypothetical protein